MREDGYTFMELLVVITIMSFLGIGILLRQNFSKEDNALKNAALDLQSFIRLAQSNAQTSTLCEGSGSTAWTIEPRNQKTVELKCDISDPPPPITQKTLNFGTTIEIRNRPFGITGNGNCDTFFPIQILTIRYPTLSAKPSFESPIGNFCVVSSSYLDINLRNTKTGNTQTVTIDKGGTVDVK